MRYAKPQDEPWLKKLYAKNKKEIGSFNLFMSWDNFIKGKRGHFFFVIPNVAFIRYHWMSKYQANVVQEIAVAEDHKGRGYGKELLDNVPLPVLLKCNADNDSGNAFYKAVGMRKSGQCATKKGVLQNIWTRA